MSSKPHVSVLLAETLKAFEGKSISTFVEGTIGAGGHAMAILEAHPEIERYIGFDQDANAIVIAKEHLKPYASTVTYVHSNFAHLKQELKKLKVKKADGFFLTWGCHRCKSIPQREVLVS